MANIGPVANAAKYGKHLKKLAAAKKAAKALKKKKQLGQLSDLLGAASDLTKGGGGATLKRTRKGGLPKRNIKIGKMKPQGRNPEAETQIKGKTFTYESYLRIQERGKTYTIVLNWRGKLITTQMFIASFKRPSKSEMTAEVQKVYPTAVVMYFSPSTVDPSKPMLFAGQET